MPTPNKLAPAPVNALAAYATAPQDQVDPYDFTQTHNTPLAPKEEKAFMKWAQKAGKLRDLYDYDLRGFWKSGAATADNGHGTDVYKKPNHPTFSDQSQYHTPDTPGGSWTQTPQGQTMFTPSPYNLQNMPAPALQQYFKQVEPDVMLNLPPR
tara:strand:+ start:120 stop:578 length:459 start_codon:yes stop_codon:yes gene_type:complete